MGHAAKRTRLRKEIFPRACGGLQVLIKLAATWEGIAAMKELEAEAWKFRTAVETTDIRTYMDFGCH